MANQNKERLNQDILHFGNAIYRVLHERRNITPSFEEELKFQEEFTFGHGLWVNSDKLKL